MSLKNSIKLFCIIILQSCAQIMAPEGGIKDSTPPIALSSNPRDSTLNFKLKKITINFNENIQLKDAQKNIAISPLVRNGFEVEAYKKKLVIKLKNLQANTTYTIDAKNSIADITEGNPIPDLKYIFSTGSILDRGRLKGFLIDAVNLKPVKNTLIGLYINFNDTTIIKSDPDYEVKSDESGIFKFENIRTGSYTLISIGDKNNNERWEPGESLAFLGAPVYIDTSTNKTVVLRQFKQDKINNNLISVTSDSRGIYLFQFDAAQVGEIKINQEDPSQDKKESYYTLDNEDDCNEGSNKKILVTSLNPRDSAHFNYTINNKIFSLPVKVSKNKELLKTEFSFYTIKINGLSLLKFNRIIDSINIKRDKIILKKDTSLLNNELLRFNTRGIIISGLNEGDYKITFQKGAITDIFGIENDSFDLILRIFGREELQTLKIKTDSTFTNKYMLTISSDFYCKRQVIEPNHNYIFDDLVPGSYKIFVFENGSGNLYFKNGDLFSRRIPDKVVYYKEIEVKSSFDIDEFLSIMFD